MGACGALLGVTGWETREAGLTRRSSLSLCLDAHCSISPIVFWSACEVTPRPFDVIPRLQHHFVCMPRILCLTFDLIFNWGHTVNPAKV